MPADKQIREFPFPRLGVDRRGPYQSQPPFSTPDALNVRPDATYENRERGGVRPGLAPMFHTQLGGGNPVQLLADVDVVDTNSFIFWSDNFSGSSMSDVWSAPGTPSSAVVPSVQNGLAQADAEDRMAVRDALSISTSSDYVVEVFVRPHDDGHDGTYIIYLRADDSTPDFSTSGCIQCKLTLRSDGTYSGSIVDGVSTYSFTGGDDNYAASGWFTALVSGNDISCYWRGNTLISAQTVSAAAGSRFGFGMSPDSYRCQVDTFRIQYTRTGNLRTSRSMVVAASNGSIYREKFMGLLEGVTGSTQNEKQRVWIGVDTPTSGTITISWTAPGQSPDTFTIDWNEDDSGFETAMKTHADVGGTDITITGGPLPGTSIVVEFEDTYGNTDVALMQIDSHTLDAGTPYVSLIQNGTTDNVPQLSSSEYLMGVDRNQKLYIADFEDPIVKNASAAMTISGADNDVLDDAAVADWTAAGPNSEPITTSHGVRITGKSQNMKQRVQLTNVSSGKFQLYFPPLNDLNTTSSLDWNVSAASLETALEGLESIGSDNVTVTATAGEVYDIEFVGDLAATDVGPVSVYENATDGQITTETVQDSKGTDTLALIRGVDATELSTTRRVITPGGETSFSYIFERSPKILDPLTGELTVWESSPGKGITPLGCKILTVYRDRMVLAGDRESPHQWYMSRLGDPLDWDYSQTDASRAVTGSLTLAGQLGEPITALMTTTDECLLFGCTTSLWILRGDPGQGGQIDNLSHEIGVVDRAAWCYTPNAMLYVLSNDGIYRMRGDCGATAPESVSRERLPDELLDVQPQLATVLLTYDVRARGIWINLVRSEDHATTQWFFDLEGGGFWPMKYNVNHEAHSAMYYRAMDSETNHVIFGGRDGYVRYFSRWDNQDDGGNEIDNYVDFGPFLLGENPRDVGVLYELRGVLGDGGPVNWSVRLGNSEELAFDATARAYGRWRRNGANPTNRPMLCGHSMLLRLEGDDRRRWTLERILSLTQARGQQRL